MQTVNLMHVFGQNVTAVMHYITRAKCNAFSSLTQLEIDHQMQFKIIIQYFRHIQMVL